MNDLEVQIVQAENNLLKLKIKWFQIQLQLLTKPMEESKNDGIRETSSKTNFKIEEEKEEETINTNFGVPKWP